MKKGFIIFFTILLPLFGNAQDNTDMAVLAMAKRNLGLLEDCISSMTDRNVKSDIRFSYCAEAMKFFVGQGHAFVVDGSAIDGLKCEVNSISSAGRLIKQSVPTKSYLSKIIRLYEPGYSIDVSISDCEVYVLLPSDIVKVSDELYRFKAKFYKSMGDIKNGVSKIVTIVCKPCECCDCGDVSILFGNIIINERRKL